MTTALADAVRDLRERLREVTDRLELQQLVDCYGPTVDAGCSVEAGSLWTDDGVYDTYPAPMRGAAAVTAMVLGPAHQGLIAHGCGHVTGPQHIVVDGDRAVVTCYSMLLRAERSGDRFWIWRLTAGRWECVRSTEGWKVQLRVHRLLDGSPEARDLLAPAAGVRTTTAAGRASGARPGAASIRDIGAGGHDTVAEDTGSAVAGRVAAAKKGDDMAGTDQGLEATVRRLERQLQAVTDRLEIQQLIASYGPAVDSGSCDEAGSLWADDGVYDSDPHPMHGPKAVADVMRGPGHQGYIHGGCAHFLGPAHIVLNGDSAEATCYSMLVRKEPDSDRFYVFRLSANRWELTRTPDGWKVQLRTNKLLDGNEKARALLAQAAGVREMTRA